MKVQVQVQVHMSEQIQYNTSASTSKSEIMSICIIAIKCILVGSSSKQNQMCQMCERHNMI